IKFFETAIRPVLVEHCQKCHGSEKQWGNLRLDSGMALLKGGDTGAAVIPGQPEKSLLIKAILQTDEDLKMPPKGKLTEKQIADFTQWVKLGAPYPATPENPKIRHRDPKHWSFQSPVDPPIPTVNDKAWPKSALDFFILAKLEGEKLSPAAQTDRRTLIRRATFDLTGLPPTPDEITAFLADESPDAFSRVVDRLLDSPAYGERWGRHWLDIARYADSNGLDENVAQGNAFRYRDYVVASLNQDKPYDQFLIEQLAGDLLPTDDPALRHERLIATGFLAIGPKVLAEVDEAKMQMDIVDEQIDTVGRALLGLTLGCARCHDHKFDPIDTADYYGLAGIFKSTQTMDSFKKVAIWHENPIHTAEEIKRKAAFDEQLAMKKTALQKATEMADSVAKAAIPAGETPAAKLETRYPEETKTRLKQLKDELTAFEKTAPEMSSAMGVKEAAVADVAINIRGNPLKLGDVVPRHVPKVLTPLSPPQFTPQQSGRLELAKSLVEKQHPLTSRVIVNRVWRWHFGKGLVRTVDNFGLLGQPSTHPELLDWLAHRFMEQGWSFKKLHRLIMLSSTYQLSSQVDASTAERDPENRWYGRANIQRLEAEEVRDAMLAVSGKLDRTLGGTLLNVKNRAYFFDHTSKDLTDYSSLRRSLYLPIVRNNVYDIFQLLDYPDAAIPTGDRTSTTVAPQALLMMNSELVTRASSELAGKLLNPALNEDGERLQRLYVLAYGREATADEITQSKAFVKDIEKAFEKQEPDPATRRVRAWETLCQVALASNEFIYLR
ncbi:MAG: hypothetical protein JWM11_2834, partial [Planctomycetaceae bacterium]|nr:hypothetical protein [Planctomycetaceae bacterium]